MSLLNVNNLSVTMNLPSQTIHAVNGISFDLKAGEVLGIVGESGSGKTQSMLAMLGLSSEETVCSGTADYQQQNLLQLDRGRQAQIRGNDIAMIFQDPMSSLNPFLRISTQLTEAIQYHRKLSRREARQRAISMLEKVQIPDATRRIDHYPHQFSGGMRQRLMVAMALLREPKILIADEPTTSLDVTVQAEILTLLTDLRDEMGLSIILITHDLGIVASTCDRVLVMYAGRIVEQANVDTLFEHASHPYTQGLLRSVRSVTEQQGELYSIEGNPPVNTQVIDGCAFSSRCAQCMPVCNQRTPLLKPLLESPDNNHSVACHLYD